MRSAEGQARAFWEASALNLLWMNASEVLRYFGLVRPRMAHEFSEVPGITPVDLHVGLLWAAWDSLLIAASMIVFWLFLGRYGPSVRAAIAAATLVWTAVFVLLWLGLYNMGLATLATIEAALPLAWIELVVAACVLAWRMGARSRNLAAQA